MKLHTVAFLLLSGFVPFVTNAQTNRPKTVKEDQYYQLLHDLIRNAVAKPPAAGWDVVSETTDHSHVLPAKSHPENKGPYMYVYRISFYRNDAALAAGLDSLAAIAVKTEAEANQLNEKMERFSASFKCDIEVVVNSAPATLTYPKGDIQMLPLLNSVFAARGASVDIGAGSVADVTMIGIGNWAKPKKYKQTTGGLITWEALPAGAAPDFSFQNISIRIVATPGNVDAVIRQLDLSGLRQAAGKDLFIHQSGK